MSRNTKIILGTVGSTLLFCIGLTVAFIFLIDWKMDRDLANLQANRYVRDPALIAQMAETMADYNLPQQYSEALVTKLSSTNVLYIFAKEETPGHLNYPRITLVQFPPKKYASAQAARAKMRQIGPQTEIEDGQITSVEESATSIRGQGVTLTIVHWVDRDGVERRSQLSDVFAGKQGYVQLLIEGPVEGWDQEMVDGFIASMR